MGDEARDPGARRGEPEAGEGEAPEAEGDARTAGDPGRSERRAGRSDETLRTEALPDSAPCPHCGGRETEQFAAFGSSLSVSQYYCRDCRTVFEFFKWR